MIQTRFGSLAYTLSWAGIGIRFCQESRTLTKITDCWGEDVVAVLEKGWFGSPIFIGGIFSCTSKDSVAVDILNKRAFYSDDFSLSG